MFPIFHVFLPLLIWEMFNLKLQKLPISRFWLIIGAIFPDLVDKPLSIFFPTFFSGRGIAHAPLVLVSLWGILYFMVKRKDIAISLGIGMIFHLLLDLPGSIPWLWPFVEYPILPADIDSYFYLLLHCGAFLARFKPGFFRSLTRESLVKNPCFRKGFLKLGFISSNALEIPCLTASAWPTFPPPTTLAQIFNFSPCPTSLNGA